MSSRSVLTLSVALAGVASGVGLLAELNDDGGSASPAGVMIARFLLLTAFSAVGIYAARESSLAGSIVVDSEDSHAVLRSLINHGVLPGFVLGLVNYLFFFTHRYSPLVAPRIRNMDDVYDSLLISIDAGVAEEIIYRLFILSSLLFLFQHLYRQLQPAWPVLITLLPRALALVFSSLLFATAHNVHGFTAAFFGGVVLGLIYLRSNVESVIVAHTVANLLFFSAVYLW